MKPYDIKPPSVRSYLKKVWRKAGTLEGRKWLASIGGERVPTIVVTLALCALLGYGIAEQARIGFTISLAASIVILLLRMAYCLLWAGATIDHGQAVRVAALESDIDCMHKAGTLKLDAVDRIFNTGAQAMVFEIVPRPHPTAVRFNLYFENLRDTQILFTVKQLSFAFENGSTCVFGLCPPVRLPPRGARRIPRRDNVGQRIKRGQAAGGEPILRDRLRL